jgi:hypothetical protein
MHIVYLTIKEDRTNDKGTVKFIANQCLHLLT